MFFFLVFRWHVRLFFLFGERFSRKESKTQKRFAGAKQGATKDDDEAFVGLGGWKVFVDPIWELMPWDFFGYANAHPPSTFPLACQHPPKKLFKIPVDVVWSFKLQHGNSKLETFEARRHVVEFCWCLISFKAPWCHWILYLVKQSHWQFVSRKYLLFYHRVWNFKEQF